MIALPQIAHHKAALLASRPRIEPTWRHDYAPGLHEGTNGERIAATERELTFYSAAGKPLRTAPNGGPAFQIVNLERRLGLTVPAPIQVTEKARATLQAKTDDDKVLETYIKHRKLAGYIEREARDVWALFKTLTDSKPLKDCDRDDGRKLVAHFEGQRLKSATIEKKIAWLNAAVNFAIKEGRLKFNPFASIVPRVRDKTRRLPLADADMKAISATSPGSIKPINCWSACWRQQGCGLARHSSLTAKKKSVACAMSSLAERPINHCAASLCQQPCCRICRSPSWGRCSHEQSTRTVRRSV